MYVLKDKYLLLLHKDETIFPMSAKPINNNNKGDEKNPIELLDEISGNSGILPTPEQIVSAHQALGRQRDLLATFNDNMNKKRPADVSPEDSKKKPNCATDKATSVSPNQTSTVTTTKTIKDENGAITTVKTIEEITRPSPIAAALRQSQSNLSIYGFTGSTKDGAKVIPIYQAKVTKPSKKKAFDAEVNNAIAGLEYTAVRDNPLLQEVAKLVKQSDVIFLNVQEVEEDIPEPRFFVWDGVDAIKGCGQEEETIHPRCRDCFADACCEFLWGLYCLAAVERYFHENYSIANEKDAYVVFTSHFNRQLDIHSYNESGNAEALRPTQITKPPLCMREGSLKHAIRWIKWQKAYGPHADWYNSQRRRRQRNRQTAEAKEQMQNCAGQLN